MTPRGILAWRKNKKVERTSPSSKNHFKVTYWDGQEKWTDDYPGDGRPGRRQERLEKRKRSRPSVKDAKETLGRAVKKYIGGGEKKGLEDAVDNVIVHLGREMARTTIRAYLKDEKVEEDGKVKEAQGVIKDRMLAKLRNKTAMENQESRVAEMVYRVADDSLKNIILTGPPSAGKTTMTKILKGMMPIVEEAARDVIQRWNSTNRWGKGHNLQDEIYDEALNRQKDAPMGTIFDRTHLDSLAYGYVPKEPPPPIKNAEVWVLKGHKHRYKNDSERKETFEEAQVIGEKLKKTYKELGYDVREIDIEDPETWPEWVRKRNEPKAASMRVAGGKSGYPTMQQVEHASLYQLTHWNRYLQSPGEWAVGNDDFEKILDNEVPIITRIVERIKELGGITPAVSKAVGWDRRGNMREGIIVSRIMQAMGERKDISRVELSRLLGGRRFSFRKVSFQGLGYGEAYALKVEGVPGGDAFSREVYDANKEIFEVIKGISEKYTWMGLPIIRSAR